MTESRDGTGLIHADYATPSDHVPGTFAWNFTYRDADKDGDIRDSYVIQHWDHGHLVGITALVENVYACSSKRRKEPLSIGERFDYPEDHV